MPDGSNRNSFTISNQMTLSEVLLRISLGAGLTPQRRRNLCSALRGVGKLMNRDLSYLPAHPGFYRPMFKGLHPEHCGLNPPDLFQPGDRGGRKPRRGAPQERRQGFPERMAKEPHCQHQVRCPIRHQDPRMRYTGCIHQGHTYMAPLTPAWQALWDKADCAGRLRVYVSRLMHYCSAQDIAPGDVDDGVSEQLKGALVEESFVGNPVKTHKDILRIWNKLVELVPDWPQVRLTISNDRDDYSIPLEQFPKPFRDEVDALVEHWSGKDILDDNGPDKPLKPRTIKSRLYRILQVVSALVLEGRNIDEIVSLSQIVEVDAAKTVLRFYLNRAGGNTTSQVHGLAILIKTLAKYWIKVDKEHLDALKTLCSKVDPNINSHFPSELNIRCPEMEIML